MLKKSIFLLLPSLLLLGCNNGSGGGNGVIYWNESVDACLKETLGEYIGDLPVFTEATSYEAENFAEGSLNYTYIDCVTELNPTMSNLVYRTELMNEDFTITTLESGVYQAYKSVTTEYMLVVQFSGFSARECQDGSPHFRLYAYLYQDKSVSWPSEDVVSVLGEDIPHYEAEYYNSLVQDYDGVTYFQIGCYGVSSSSEDEYYDILKENGYIVRSNSSYCNAVHNTKLINLNFYYDSDYECLLIVGNRLDEASVWPEAEIRSLFGFDLPVYSDPAVTYQSGYMKFEYYEGTERFITSRYCIECDYAPQSALLAYDGMLKEAGWSVDEGDLPEDWPLFLCSEGHFERYTLTDGDVTHSVEIRYYDPDDPNQSGYDLSYPIFLIMIYC